jgi:hypothetical protein
MTHHKINFTVDAEAPKGKKKRSIDPGVRVQVRLPASPHRCEVHNPLHGCQNDALMSVESGPQASLTGMQWLSSMQISENVRAVMLSQCCHLVLWCTQGGRIYDSKTGTTCHQVSYTCGSDTSAASHACMRSFMPSAPHVACSIQ